MHWKLEECQSTRVILVRHGQSTYNALGLYQGSSDESVLTEKGYSTARQTGAFLKGLAFDAIYSSSLKRAHETAREILRVITPNIDPKKIFVTDQLRETDLPAWHGLTFDYVRENFAADYRTWKQRPHEFRMETHHQYFYPALDLYKRVQQFWQEVLSHHVGQVLLVTHGGTNRALISTAIGVCADRYHCIQQSNCGISVLNFPDGCLESGRLEALNLTSHVGENLPKLHETGQGLRLMIVPSGAINPEQTQQLAELLKTTPIDFCISENSHFQATAQQILQYHPTTVQFEVLREDFPEAWLQTIAKRSTVFASTQANSNQLITGLVVTGEYIVKRFIGQVLGMNSNQMERLQLLERGISCIYYPYGDHPPVLQAMNISGSVEETYPGFSSVSDESL